MTWSALLGATHAALYAPSMSRPDRLQPCILRHIRKTSLCLLRDLVNTHLEAPFEPILQARERLETIVLGPELEMISKSGLLSLKVMCQAETSSFLSPQQAWL